MHPGLNSRSCKHACCTFRRRASRQLATQLQASQSTASARSGAPAVVDDSSAAAATSRSQQQGPGPAGQQPAAVPATLAHGQPSQAPRAATAPAQPQEQQQPLTAEQEEEADMLTELKSFAPPLLNAAESSVLPSACFPAARGSCAMLRGMAGPCSEGSANAQGGRSHVRRCASAALPMLHCVSGAGIRWLDSGLCWASSHIERLALAAGEDAIAAACDATAPAGTVQTQTQPRASKEEHQQLPRWEQQQQEEEEEEEEGETAEDMLMPMSSFAAPVLKAAESSEFLCSSAVWCHRPMVGAWPDSGHAPTRCMATCALLQRSFALDASC